MLLNHQQKSLQSGPENQELYAGSAHRKYNFNGSMKSEVNYHFRLFIISNITTGGKGEEEG